MALDVTLSRYALLTSLLGYSAIMVLSKPRLTSSQDFDARTKLLSTLHSTVVSLGALYVLRDNRNWRGEADGWGGEGLIQARDQRANALTALETGYLACDTIALLVGARMRGSGWKVDPVLMAHHVGIGAALGVLQWYIARGRERGIFIILMFLLMNSS